MARKSLKFREPDKGTRQRLLEAAGQVFGEKGFDRTTAKEITERAGANVASVSYYFGGIENLYNAVLDEAHNRLLTLDALSLAVASEAEPKGKLRAITALVVRAAAGPASTSWVIRVIGRELVAPSSGRQPHENQSVAKLKLIREVVAECMGLLKDDPAVVRGFTCLIAPLLVLLIGDRPTVNRRFPGVSLVSADSDSMIDDLHCYALAGLIALSKKTRK